MPPFTVRFVLSNNYPGSSVRLTTDFANALVELGVATKILFPAVDWWDYKSFALLGIRPEKRWRWKLRLAGELAAGIVRPGYGRGFRRHPVDPRVQMHRYFLRPTARDWREEEVTVVHCPYQIPYLLSSCPPRNMKLVSVIHVNLEEATQSTSAEVAAWYRHCVTLDRFLSVPRYAVSEVARRSAERLGIPVRRVIPNGIDLKLFHPSRIPHNGGPPTVTLYCDLKAQKGQRYGIEAVKAVKAITPEIRLCSLGTVMPEHVGLFNHHYGYLHGRAYADALRESDILIYPSLYDGFPAPPLEALACGAALIVTTVEGVTEYAVHEGNALLAEPRDSEALRDLLLRLVRDPVLRQRLRENGPKTAQRFSVEHCARQLLEFLQEVYDE